MTPQVKAALKYKLRQIRIDPRGTMATTLGAWFEDEDGVFDKILDSIQPEIERSELTGRLAESRHIEAQIALIFGDNADEIEGTLIHPIARSILRRQKDYNAALTHPKQQEKKQ